MQLIPTISYTHVLDGRLNIDTPIAVWPGGWSRLPEYHPFRVRRWNGWPVTLTVRSRVLSLVAGPELDIRKTTKGESP